MLLISLVILVIFVLIFTFGTILGINEIQNYIKHGTPRNLYSGVFLLYMTIIIVLAPLMLDLIYQLFIGFPDLMSKILTSAVFFSCLIPFLFLKRICYFFHILRGKKDKDKIKDLYEESLKKWKEIRE